MIIQLSLPLEDSAKLPTRLLLKRIGFAEDLLPMTDEQPAFRYNFGNMVLTAAQVTNKYFRSVFQCSGIWSNGRQMELIEFELPMEVRSFEEGVAMMAYYVGDSFRPTRPTEWLAKGLELSSALPWNTTRGDMENGG